LFVRTVVVGNTQPCIRQNYDWKTLVVIIVIIIIIIIIINQISRFSALAGGIFTYPGM
jgi:uncharacterized integral membrane protein